MTKEATRAALSALLSDTDLAGKVSAGDLTALGDADLSGDERELLVGAATEIAQNDVTGFAGRLGAGGLDQGHGITLDNGLKHQGITLDNGIKFMPRVRETLNYLQPG